MKKVFTVFVLLFMQFHFSQIFISEGAHIYAEKESLLDSLIQGVPISYAVPAKNSPEKTKKKKYHRKDNKNKAVSGKTVLVNKNLANKQITEQKSFAKIFKSSLNNNNSFKTTERQNSAVTFTSIFKIIDIAVIKYFVNQSYYYREVKILNSQIFHFYSQTNCCSFSVRPPPTLSI
ncbi:hypothetical protein H9Q08_03770 [Chryseobacterium sp. PS-8]|uniref:Uncharacterized protein n=1 Tax=Chryseobacterium indicum TaxID=2766954 RepID=A0ABS9C407_9FLAO|nr:hypothetical protein [Chryseobacterium sp. PS-8]MCF2218414.1 hypothetical protein [Chryseobacterium sp. PS-8]